MRGEHSALKAILTADIEGFSTRMRQDESAIVRLLVDTYYAVVRRHVERHGGQLFRKEGDAVWCSFDSGLSCLRAGVAIQEEMHVLREERPVRLRMGAHLGDVTVTADGEILGHTLSVAKRLETACAPGGIAISEDLYQQVSGRRLGFAFESKGEVELKGVGVTRVWEGSLTPERRAALEAQAAESGRTLAVPRILMLAHVGGLPEARRTAWERTALRVSRRLGATLLHWDDSLSVVVSEVSPAALELVRELEGPRLLLAAGEVLLRTDEGGAIEEVYGTAMEQALEGIQAGRQPGVVLLTPAAAEIAVAARASVEPWGDGLYRLVAGPGELTEACAPRRVTSACARGLVDMVAGTRRGEGLDLGLRAQLEGWQKLEGVLAGETRELLSQHAEVGLAVALAMLASKHRDSLPADLIAVGAVAPDGTLSGECPACLRGMQDGLVLGPPGASAWGLRVPVVEVPDLAAARAWMVGSGSHGHARRFAEALEKGRLCVVLSGPLGGSGELAALQSALAEAAGLPRNGAFAALAEEAEEEMGRSLVLDTYKEWVDRLPARTALGEALSHATPSVLVSLFPDPRVAELSGKTRLLADGEVCLSESDTERMLGSLTNLPKDVSHLLGNSTLLLVGCPGTEDSLKAFYRQLRLHVPAGPDQRAFYLAPEASEAEERWWERREVELVREPLDRLLASASRASPRVPVGRVQAHPGRTPYKFLHYYGPGDRAIFFGREVEIEQLLTRLVSHPVLVVYGKSGVGKTSLLQAGVLGRLRRPQHLMLTLRALSDPVALIHSRLAALGRVSEELTLAELMNRLAASLSGHLVVVLDQFEEFFVRHSFEQRRSMVTALCACAAALGERCHLVFSMREDFLAEMSEFESEYPSILDNRFRVRRLRAEQARQAILGPAELFGLQVDDELVEELLDQLMEEGIDPPELQIVLDSLVPDLTLEKYRTLGGVKRILVGYLQQTLDRLGPDRDRARALLRAMVTERGTKAVVGLAELGEAAHELLPRLVDSRLVRALEEGGEPRYELAHEYVIAEVQSWTTDEELAAKHAAVVLKTELANWQRFGSLMGPDRLAILERERESLTIGREERALLLRAAAVHGASLGCWTGEGSAEVMLAMLADSSLPGEVKRSLIEALFPLEVDMEPVLAAAEQVGNPFLLERLGRVATGHGRRMREMERRIRTRFFGPSRMAQVPAGPCWVGSSAENKALRMSAMRPDLHPRVQSERDLEQVDLPEFWMDRCPISNADYAEFRPVHRHYFAPEEARLPVVYVSYYDALAYCEWLGKTLPTEEQWEKAARGTDGRLFPWGDEFDPARLNSAESGLRKLTEVDAYPSGASPYGCLNMSGTIWEWTVTPWEPGSPFMTKKGGCSVNFAPLMHSSARFEDLPELILQWVGFRACSSSGP